MKFTVTMKDPDALYEACHDAAEEYAKSVEGLDADERKALSDLRFEKLRDFADQYMRYGEYIDVEFDTDANTAIVLKDDQ